MSEEGSLVLLILVSIGLTALVLVALTPSQSSIQDALAAGRVTEGMTERQVLSVWGEPDELETMTSKTSLSPAEGFLDALTNSRFEQATTFYSYTMWVYKNPWRTVTFSSAKRVVDYSPEY